MGCHVTRAARRGSTMADSAGWGSGVLASLSPVTQWWRQRGGVVGGADHVGDVHVGCCNWGDESHADRVRSQGPGGRVDVIIGSDLIYRQSRATFEALLGTVSALCNTGGVSAGLRNEQDQHQPTRVLFCTKHRMNPEDGKQHSNV